MAFMFCMHTGQAPKKVLSISLGQVDFLAEQVTFKTYLPSGQGGSKRLSCKQNH